MDVKEEGAYIKIVDGDVSFQVLKPYEAPLGRGI